MKLRNLETVVATLVQGRSGACAGLKIGMKLRLPIPATFKWRRKLPAGSGGLAGCFV